VCCAIYAAWSLWVLGHPARAVARMQDALERARFDGHPFAVSWACTFAAGLHACRRDVDAVRALTDAAVPIATEHGFELLRNLGAAFRGWVRSETGERTEGAEELRAGVAAFREHGGGIGLPTFLGLLAHAYGTCERRDDGLGVLADALAMSKASGAHYWDAELLRLRGALLVGSPTPSRRDEARSERAAAERDAESSFMAAVELARRQHAKSLELRVATSLGRLFQTQGKRREAHALLSGVYGEFAEGFDAADLRDAKAVLDGLERAPARR
jgi:predicted ATPase